MEFIEVVEAFVDKETTSILKTERTVKVYDNPNWAFKQAHTNGYLKALGNIEHLIDQYKKKQKEERVDRLTTTNDGTAASDRPYEVIS